MNRVMMVVVFGVASSPALADQATDSLVGIVKRAAAQGDCATSNEVGERVRRRDERAFTADLATDPAVAACMSATPLPPPAAVTRVAAPVPRQELAPVRAGRIVGQSLAGALGAALGIIPAAALLDDCDGGCGALLGIAAVTMSIGASAGVALGGIGDGGEVSGLATFGGSLAFSVASLALAEQTNSDAAIPLVIIAPVIGAMTGYHLTRSPVEPAREGVLPTPTVSAGSGTTLLPIAGFEF